jgi:uncharacterized membrane protein
MLTILEILYIVLIMFTSIVGTLLIIALLRVIKILWPITEIADFYNKIKQILSAYKQIPELFKEKVQEVLAKKDER